MYNMLVDYIEIPEEAIDIVLKVLGDTPQTYIKILNKCTDYKTFNEVDEDYTLKDYAQD